MGVQQLEREQPVTADQADSAKRRQIMDGARKVFLAHGFDGASMGEIARAAGVSKGTLYVYFDSKEKLFETITHEACLAQAEGVFAFDHADHDVAAVLTRTGRGFIKFLARPGGMSALRTVISIAGRMPEIGVEFYDTGPAKGIALLQEYLETQVAAGILAIDDCEVAAAQFLDACGSSVLKQLLFNARPVPSDDRIDYLVGTAVRVFMKAYSRAQ
ncbi:MAG: TetR/AcrR family transcriptional regulator [Hyphomicrobiales bacterium]|nr:TetR/AcrR family transcriptional regulator [Hyphomicrobiales bacterium]MBV8826614.1 TetR/AcrR family transcriptional regulator [Hyphomicrobiales bacterium]MBV9430043.1 TetR/AcrR family transcriptional regulator [Bradyrhizobiaceae bacterium]